VSEHTIIQIIKFIVYKLCLKKRALQIGLHRDIDGPIKHNENTNGVGLHLTLPATRINYYKQVEACVRTTNDQPPAGVPVLRSGSLGDKVQWKFFNNNRQAWLNCLYKIYAWQVPTEPKWLARPFLRKSGITVHFGDRWIGRRESDVIGDSNARASTLIL
jgi:hypothetical protein